MQDIKLTVGDRDRCLHRDGAKILYTREVDGEMVSDYILWPLTGKVGHQNLIDYIGELAINNATIYLPDNTVFGSIINSVFVPGVVLQKSLHITDEKNPNLNFMLDAVSVAEVDDYHQKLNPGSPLGWYMVMTDCDSVIAYFSSEKEALRYRLDLINRKLNG